MVQVDLFGRAPEVYIDIHEVTNKRKHTSITLFRDILEKNKIPYQVKKLEVADLLLPNDYAIVRKTVKDFCTSLFGSKDGRPRLFEQIKALVETYEHPFLLLEGGLSVRLDPTTKSIFIPVSRRQIRDRIWSVVEEQIRIDPRQFSGALRYVEESGVTLLKSFDAKHGSQILYSLYLEAKGFKERKPERAKKYPIVRQKPSLKTLQDRQLFFLSGLPRISVVNARKILEKYETPFNAIMKFRNWSKDVEGIGDKTVDEIRKVLLSRWEGDKNES